MVLPTEEILKYDAYVQHETIRVAILQQIDSKVSTLPAPLHEVASARFRKTRDRIAKLALNQSKRNDGVCFFNSVFFAKVRIGFARLADRLLAMT